MRRIRESSAEGKSQRSILGWIFRISQSQLPYICDELQIGINNVYSFQMISTKKSAFKKRSKDQQVKRLIST